MKQLSILFFVFIATQGLAQYTAADTLDNVVISWKWAAEKWYKPKSDRVLLVMVSNHNTHSVDYQFTLGISRDGKMLESTPSQTYCLAAGKTIKGRLNGIVLKPTAVNRKDISEKNFDMEMELDSVEKSEGCKKK
jgi:hypothetical protein